MPRPEITIDIDLKGSAVDERKRLGQLLFRQLAQVGSVSDGGGGRDQFSAWVAVDDAPAALLKVQAIVAGQGLAERARIRIRPKLATITVEWSASPDSSLPDEASATAMMNDLAWMIDERQIGDSLATGFIGTSIVVSTYVFNPDVGIPVIEALIDELGIAAWVVVELRG